MRPSQEAQRLAHAARRQAEREAREILRAKQAMALDPALTAAAKAVHDALVAERFDAWVCRDHRQHVVALRSIASRDKGKVEYLANRATKDTPVYPDCVHLGGSHMRVEMKFGRAIYEREQYMARHAEWGTIYVAHEDGRITMQGAPDAKPLTTSGDDQYSITEKAS